MTENLNHNGLQERKAMCFEGNTSGNSGLASVGQTVHIEIFVIFAIGSG